MKINIPEWISIKTLSTLFEILGADTTRIVGGAVRNTIMRAGETDIDLATILTPDEVIEKCNAANIKTVPTGIDHGTVTIVMEGQNFEITTLRRDVGTDGRHADVEFTNDWLEDAKRRDFTMNALYMDLEGNVLDPLGRGIEAVENKQVSFVGAPALRIKEDYLRILRFFRFQAQCGEVPLEEGALNACRDAASEIKTLSRERITQEFLKILATDNAAEILKLMTQNNILKDLPDVNYTPATLKALIDLQNQQEAFHLIPRLYVVGGNSPGFFEEYLRLSHVQKKFLIKLDMATTKSFFENERELKKAIFYHGNDLLIQGYLLTCAIDGTSLDENLFRVLKNWQAPKCPITGDSLIKEGFQTGPELGQELSLRVEEWLDAMIYEG